MEPESFKKPDWLPVPGSNFSTLLSFSALEHTFLQLDAWDTGSLASVKGTPQRPPRSSPSTRKGPLGLF